jgi:Uma2 family endonuclease
MTTLSLEKEIFTYEDIDRLPDGSYEIIEGKRIEMSPSGFRHGKLEFKVAGLLEKHCKDKGYVSVGEVGIVINKRPLRLRAADVVYISKEICGEEPVGILEVAPDLVIEILSEDEKAHYINEKISDYLSIGVGRVVLLDPYTEVVTVYKHESKEAFFCRFNEEFELMPDLKIKMSEVNA